MHTDLIKYTESAEVRYLLMWEDSMRRSAHLWWISDSRVQKKSVSEVAVYIFHCHSTAVIVSKHKNKNKVSVDRVCHKCDPLP